MKHYRWNINTWPMLDQRKPALHAHNENVDGRSHFVLNLTKKIDLHVMVAKGLATVSNTLDPLAGTVLVFKLGGGVIVEASDRPAQLSAEMYDLMVQAAEYAVREVSFPGENMLESEEVRAIRESWNIQHDKPCVELLTDGINKFMVDDEGRVTLHSDELEAGYVSGVEIVSEMQEGEMTLRLMVTAGERGRETCVEVHLDYLGQLCAALDCDPSVVGDNTNVLRYIAKCGVFMGG